jgi:hypothetical protein
MFKVLKQQLMVLLPTANAPGTLEGVEARTAACARRWVVRTDNRGYMKSFRHLLVDTQRQRFENLKTMSAKYSIYELFDAFGMARTGYPDIGIVLRVSRHKPIPCCYHSSLGLLFRRITIFVIACFVIEAFGFTIIMSVEI